MASLPTRWQCSLENGKASGVVDTLPLCYGLGLVGCMENPEYLNGWNSRNKRNLGA